MKVISVRENPEIKDQAIKYFQSKWKSVLPIIYEDCINHTIGSPAPLPQWYLLEKFGFEYIGQGYHPWGEESRIYQFNVESQS